MPYRCVSCGHLYDDNDPQVLKGCEHCGGKLFVYVPKEVEVEKVEEKVSIEIKEREEGKIDLTVKSGSEEISIEGVETIIVEEPGTYIIDVDKLMKGHPIVLKTEEGTYRVYLPSLFGKQRKKV